MQTDGHDKHNSHFSQFCEVPKKGDCIVVPVQTMKACGGGE
jgi:hypothetical protein